MGRKSIIEAERDSINTSGPKPKQSQFRLLEAKYFPKTTGSYNETPYVKSKHLLNKWAEVRGKFRHSIRIFNRGRYSLFHIKLVVDSFLYTIFYTIFFFSKKETLMFISNCSKKI